MRLFWCTFFSFVGLGGLPLSGWSFSIEKIDKIADRLEAAELRLKSIAESSSMPEASRLNPSVSQSQSLPAVEIPQPQVPFETGERKRTAKIGSYDIIEERLREAEAKLKKLYRSNASVKKRPTSVPVSVVGSLPSVEIPMVSSKDANEINQKYGEIFERIQSADEKLRALKKRSFSSTSVNMDSIDQSDNGETPSDVLIEEGIANEMVQRERETYGMPSSSTHVEMAFANSSPKNPHEVGFGINYVLPFEAEFVTSSGVKFPIKYGDGVQVEFDYLYHFKHLAIGTVFSFAASKHESLGPIPGLVSGMGSSAWSWVSPDGVLGLDGQSRALGGELLTSYSRRFGGKYEISAKLGLGLAKRKDEFYLFGENLRDTGTAFKYSFGIGLTYDLNDDYKVGLQGKYQRINGLGIVTDSDTFMVGLSGHKQF